MPHTGKRLGIAGLMRFEQPSGLLFEMIEGAESGQTLTPSYQMFLSKDLADAARENGLKF